MRLKTIIISFESRSRSGFTLFEIAISLAIMTFGVISVLMLLPAGLKAQHMARYQILASAKAVEMVEAYNASHNTNPSTEVEAPEPWDIAVSGKVMQPDLEARLSTYRFGMFPLPLDIAKRLDSDGDEIQQILAQGGYLYYSQPLASTGMQDNGFEPTTQPNEAQKLIMAVVGYPQNNALWALPQKAWPYYAVYPSPPAHILTRSNTRSGLHTRTVDIWASDAGRNALLWEDVNLGGPAGVDLRKVFNLYKTLSKLGGTNPKDATVVDAAKKYGEAIVAWCKTHVPAGAEICWNGSAEIPMVNGTYQFPVPTKKHVQVLAARLMGHLGPTMLAGKIAGDPDPQIDSIIFTEQSVANMHANCLALGFTFAASYPYDWGAPRPLQRAIMMDFPLIEWDLMVDYEAPLPIATDPTVPVSPSLYKGTIFGDSKTAYKWRPTTPHPVVNGGASFTYPDLAGDGLTADQNYWRNIWSSTHNSTLTASFTAAERCRQIVFWAVDWQSYEDFETAPSAPVDASKYPRQAPIQGANFNSLCNSASWMDHHMFGYRNPEKVIIFNGDMTNRPTGTLTPMGGRRDPGTQGPDVFGRNTTDKGLGNIKKFLGLYGADRNANQRLDRGSVPKSVRLRATTVSRFNYYDMRVPAVIR